MISRLQILLGVEPFDWTFVFKLLLPLQSAPPRIKWTRRVLHPVLIGHAASLTPY
jgi:hypothetical protein